jgi:hypothetical protein
MTTSFKNNIAAQVVTDFLSELKMTDIDAEVVARLEKTILKEEKVSEAALRAAIFGNSEND